ncbi:MAG: hypothetical protein KC417_11780 [Myxococcales bacterium]|nr:hypothetical protein [Myxococcales bacterium]
MQRYWLRLSLLVALVPVAMGCDDSSKTTDDGGAHHDGDVDGSDSTDGGDQDAMTDNDMNVSKEVKAADGAEIENENLHVEIPPTSLEEDTTITVNGLKEADLPNPQNLLSEAYDFGPDGTMFEIPVKLTFSNVTIPAGKFVDVAFINEENEWEPLPFTDVDGTTVTSWTTHFTSFAVLLRGTGSQFDNACSQEFDACGGDLSSGDGYWSFTGDADCATIPFALALETAGACPGITGSIESKMTGNIGFYAGKGTTFQAYFATAFAGTVTVPDSCYENSTCPEGDGAASFSSSDSDCVGTLEHDEQQQWSGTWLPQGGTVSFFDGEDSRPAAQWQYCLDTKGSKDLSDDVVHFRALPHDGPEYRFTAVRAELPK